MRYIVKKKYRTTEEEEATPIEIFNIYIQRRHLFVLSASRWTMRVVEMHLMDLVQFIFAPSIKIFIALRIGIQTFRMSGDIDVLMRLLYRIF